MIFGNASITDNRNIRDCRAGFGGLTIKIATNTISFPMATVVDLHVHTTRGSSDSSLSPEDMVVEAKRLDLPGLCITEHNAHWDRHEFTDFARKHDLLLIRGVEIDTNMGHVLVFGLNSYTSGMADIEELRAVVDEEGGFMITAHPFRNFHDLRPNSVPLMYRDGSSLPSNLGEASGHPVFDFVDAIEVANGSTVDEDNALAFKVSRQRKQMGTGGSDAHSIHGLGRCTTVFNDDIRSEREFLDALRSGNFYAAQGLRAGTSQPFTG